MAQGRLHGKTLLITAAQGIGRATRSPAPLRVRG
jgi:hypothetical protein